VAVAFAEPHDALDFVSEIVDAVDVARAAERVA